MERQEIQVQQPLCVRVLVKFVNHSCDNFPSIDIRIVHVNQDKKKVSKSKKKGTNSTDCHLLWFLRFLSSGAVTSVR